MEVKGQKWPAMDEETAACSIKALVKTYVCQLVFADRETPLGEGPDHLEDGSMIKDTLRLQLRHTFEKEEHGFEQFFLFMG